MDDRFDVALISVGDPPRWQLPKGLVDSGETPEQAALREVREEAGVEATIEAPLDRIEYWYQRADPAGRVRIHKFVHFFLLQYTGGDVTQHDAEVNEARWMEIDEAARCLAFASERKLVADAARRLRPNG